MNFKIAITELYKSLKPNIMKSIILSAIALLFSLNRLLSLWSVHLSKENLFLHLHHLLFELRNLKRKFDSASSVKKTIVFIWFFDINCCTINLITLWFAFSQESILAFHLDFHPFPYLHPFSSLHPFSCFYQFSCFYLLWEWTGKYRLINSDSSH